MNRILGRVTQSPDKFRPATPQEFFALQLARKLQDAQHLRSYLIWVQRHPIDVLLRAFRRTIKRQNGNLGGQFRVELNRLISVEEQ